MSSAADGYLLLDSLELPADLQRLEITQLAALAAEVRALLSHNVATSPDRLHARLAAVELAIAVHHVFDSSADHIVWDSGDQALAHALLTGRRKRLHGHPGGAPSFPPHLAHSHEVSGEAYCGAAIGTALGIAVAAARLGEPRHVVAIVADGALTAGMTFEALNHAGALHTDMLVILHDSDPARSTNGGVLSNRLAQILAGPLYAQLRDGGKKVLGQMPTVRELARRSERHLKGMVLPGTMFEELGFNYIGPLDGHDIGALVATLRNLKRLRGPQLLQIITRKGELPAAGSFDAALADDGGPGYDEMLGRWLCEAAAADPRITLVTPRRRATSPLEEFARRFPERHLDVGGAQQHAVTLAAGLAVAGLRPVVAISSTALQRAYDQLIHDVALQGLPVVFAVDHAGLAGTDFATDHGAYDLSYLRCVPNLTIMAAADGHELGQMLDDACRLPGPVAVRFPCGRGPEISLPTASVGPAGLARIRRQGDSGLALLSFGALLESAAVAAERLDASLVNMRFVKPLDEDLLVALCAAHRALVTIEDNVIAGGAGAGVAELLAARGLRIPLLQVGIPAGFSGHGSRARCLAAARLDGPGIGERIERWWLEQSAEPLRAALDATDERAPLGRKRTFAATPAGRRLP
jgi:1-deoxy-D-xylulose-5-phosphate synthase